MKMRKILGFLMIFAVLTACTSANSEESPSPSLSESPSASYNFQTDPAVLGPDLEVYLNSLGNLGVLENEVVGLFDAVTGANFKGNPQLLKQLELIVPKASEFLEKLQKIKTKHPEIEHFHSEYVAIWQEQSDAFVAMKLAIENDDQVALETEAVNVQVARKRIAPLQDELQALTKYAGIEIVF